MTYEQHFLWSLLVTLLVEVPIACLFVRRAYKKSNTTDTIFAGIIASSLTLPYFWFILPIFISNRFAYVWIGESVIVLIEAYIYYRILKVSAKQAFVVSLIANVSSVIVGLFLSKLGIL